MEGKARVNGADLWYDVTGEGEPVMQIHGAGFGHFNFAPATPELAKSFRVVDFDLRGYGASDRPLQHYDMEVWADDVAGLMDVLDIETAHIHGTSMGGMIAIVFAGKYPQRTTSVVINCAAAKLGAAGRLVFKNWIDIATLDPDGPGSRVLAELIAWQALSRAFLETPDGVADSAKGIEQIVAGTGGGDLRPLRSPLARNSVFQIHGRFGVLKLTLGPGEYRHAFIATDGRVWDPGGRQCH